jgi:hypothetical protein
MGATIQATYRIWNGEFDPEEFSSQIQTVSIGSHVVVYETYERRDDWSWTDSDGNMVTPDEILNHHGLVRLHRMDQPETHLETRTI